MINIIFYDERLEFIISLDYFNALRQKKGHNCLVEEGGWCPTHGPFRERDKEDDFDNHEEEYNPVPQYMRKYMDICMYVIVRY